MTAHDIIYKDLNERHFYLFNIGGKEIKNLNLFTRLALNYALWRNIWNMLDLWSFL